MLKNEVGSAARLAAAAGLGLTLALGAAPVVAMAEGVGPVASGDVAANLADDADVTGVSTADELKSAFATGGSYRLVDNITMDSALSVPASSTVSLDLAGYTIDAKASNTISGSLTVSDSSQEGAGAIRIASGSQYSNLFIINAGSASLSIEGGQLSANNSIVSSTKENVSFIMTGGSLSSAKPVNLSGPNTTISITGGRIDASGSFAISAKNASSTVTIGSEGNYESPVIKGSISLENIPGKNIKFLGGYIEDVTNPLPAGATLKSHFGADITNVLPMNYASERQGDTWVVVEMTEENAGVKVQSGEDTLYYPSITAMNGDTQSIAPGSMITLLKDTSGSLTFSQAGKYVVDLNGHTLTASDDEPCAVRVAASSTDVTIQNGDVVLTSLASDASIVSVVGDENAAALSDVSLVFNGVSLSTTSEYASTGLIVYGLNTNNNVTLRNSSISVPSTVMGIYFPPQGESTLTVENTSITAGTGIGIKGGTLNVTGNSHITATGEKIDPDEAMSSGIQETGAAIYLEGNYATSRDVIVQIEGGTFESENNDAVQMKFASEDNPGDETPYTADINISGGSFSSSPVEFLETEHVAKVDGGTYEVMPRENLEPGDYVVANGDGAITASDLQPGLSVSYNKETGEYEVVRPYVPPVVTGDRVNVAETDGGKVTVTPTRADEGDEVTITATPDEGQEVRSVSVVDADGKSVEVRAGEKDGEYVFTMPDGAVTVTVAFGCDGGELCPTHGFNDVDQSAWYHDAVDWAVENGVLNGYGEGGESLGPVADVTRAEMAQMLWNRAGRPGAEADLSGFTDVASDGWYAPALEWCVSEGIFSGYGDTFGTERTISREEAVTVLWRLSGSPEADADLSGYGDASSVSDYAAGAVEWAVSTGVLTGKGGVALDPQAGCTRGEVAAMMMRMAE